MNWLTDRQLEAVNKLAKGRGVVWWKVGEGKTRIALAIWRKLCSKGMKTLLVVCSPQAFRQWQDEMHSLGMMKDCYVEFLSYGMLSAGSGYRGLALANKIAQRTDIGLIVLDELWLYKNPQSIRSANAEKLTKYHPTIGLSGSLITARNIEDLYGQCKAVGIGRRLAATLTDFRSQFCFAVEEYGFEYYAKKGSLQVIQSRLAEVCDIYFPKGDKQSKFQRVTVDASREQEEAFEQLRNEYYYREIEVKNAAVLITKLSQISDGFILNSEGLPAFVQSSKLTRTLQLYTELCDAGQSIVIWCAFQRSVDLLLNAIGKKATALSSVHEFDSQGWKSGKYNVCVATVGSGSSLNDFADCRYAIIYSCPFSARGLQQALGRTERKSSSHKGCHYYLMQTDGSVDSYVYESARLTGEIEKSAIRNSVQIIKEYLEKCAQRKH